MTMRATKWMAGIGLCAALCALPVATRAEPPNLGRMIAARLLARGGGEHGTARSATRPGDTINCVAFTARESHQRGSHIFACASTVGEVAGAVLSPKGKVRCDVAGTIDPATGCGTVDICSTPYDFCVY